MHPGDTSTNWPTVSCSDLHCSVLGARCCKGRYLHSVQVVYKLIYVVRKPGKAPSSGSIVTVLVLLWMFPCYQATIKVQKSLQFRWELAVVTMTSFSAWYEVGKWIVGRCPLYPYWPWGSREITSFTCVKPMYVTGSEKTIDFFFTIPGESTIRSVLVPKPSGYLVPLQDLEVCYPRHREFEKTRFTSG